MSELAKLKVGIQLDGSAFEQSLSKVRKDMQIANQQFKSSLAGVKGFQDGLEALKTEATGLEQVFKNQKMYAERMELEYKNLTNASKDNRLEADKLKIQYDDVAKRFGENSKEARELYKDMKNLEKSAESNDKKAQGLQLEYAKLVGQMNKTEAQIKAVNGKIETYDKDMAGATTKTKNMESALRNVDSATTKAGSGFSSVAGIVGKLSIAITSVYAAIKSLNIAGQGINFNANLQTSQLAFETLLGSTEKAKKMVEDLYLFGANTPFQFDGLQQSSKLLLAMGFNGEEIMPTMQKVGDAVAAIGGNDETLLNVSRALGQISTKGKLSAEEVNQLAENGIGVWQILSEKMHKSTSELMEMASNGELLSKDVLPLLIDGMGTKFKGAMDKLSKSYNGMLSTLKDNMGQLFGTLTQGLFEKLNKVLPKVISFVNKMNKIFAESGWAGVFKEFLPESLVNAITTRMDKIKQNYDGIKAYFRGDKQGFVAIFGADAPELGRILGDVKKNIEDIQLAYSGLKAYVRGDGQGLYSIFGADTPEVKKGLDDLTTSFDTLKTKVQETIDLFKGDYKSTTEDATEKTNKFSSAIANISEGLSIMLDAMGYVLDEMKPIIQEMGGMFDGMGKSWSKFWEQNGFSIGISFNDVLTTVKQAVKDTFEGFLIPIISGTMTTISGVLQGAWNIILQGISFWIAVFKGDFQGMKNSVVETVKSLCNIIDSVFNGSWVTIKGIFKNINKSIKETFDIDLYGIGTNLMKGLEIGIDFGLKYVKKKIEGLAADIPQWLKDVLGIKSPSRVLADQVGQHIPTGIALGMEKSLPKLKAMTQKMAMATVPDMNANLSNGSISGMNAVNNSTTFAPSISITANDPYAVAVQQEKMLRRLRFQGGMSR